MGTEIMISTALLTVTANTARRLRPPDTRPLAEKLFFSAFVAEALSAESGTPIHYCRKSVDNSGRIDAARTA